MAVNAFDSGAAARGGSVTGEARARLFRLARRILLGLPRRPAFDFLYALALFVHTHRRLPRRGSGLFNDDLFFLKTGDELTDPLRQFVSDKVYAKTFIDGIAGRRVTPETYAVFDTVEAIRRSDLPARCVLKPTHISGQLNVYLQDASDALTEADYAKLRRGLALDYYRESRERNYRYLRKRIICEEMVQDPDRRREFRLFCQGGSVRFLSVTHRNMSASQRTNNLYDRDWNPLDVQRADRHRGPPEPMPACFPEMRALADRIAAHFGLIRVDMYSDGERFWVGELTNCHFSAHARFARLEDERQLHDLLFG